MSTAFLVGITLNTIFVIVEIVYGIGANSLALLADAGHNIGDVLGLVLAWGATWLARKKPTARHTYGMQSASIIAALANAAFLLVVTGGLIWEAVQRIGHPTTVAEIPVMVVAAVGIVINGATALMFMRGHKDDLNIRGAFLHMASDAAVSFGVVISGAIMLQTGWTWLDPAVGIVIALVIIAGTCGLLKDSVNLALHAVPSAVDYAAIKTLLETLPGVREVHDLHIWAMSTTDAALTAHLVMREKTHPGDMFLTHLTHELHRLGVAHPTLQIELGDGAANCNFAPADVV